MDLRSDDSVGRQHQPRPLLAREADDAPRVVELILLDQALAQCQPTGGKEGIGHAAADEHGLAARQEHLEHLELVRHFRPADDGVERSRRATEEAGERLDLALHEQAGNGREMMGDALGAGVGAVRGPEGVVDVEFGKAGQRRGEFGVVGLLGRVEAQVFEQQQVARAQLVDGHLHPRSERVAGHAHGPAEQQR